MKNKNLRYDRLNYTYLLITDELKLKIFQIFLNALATYSNLSSV